MAQLYSPHPHQATYDCLELQSLGICLSLLAFVSIFTQRNMFRYTSVYINNDKVIKIKQKFKLKIKNNVKQQPIKAINFGWNHLNLDVASNSGMSLNELFKLFGLQAQHLKVAKDMWAGLTEVFKMLFNS